MKRITSSLLALLLALSMLIGMVPAAYAAPADTIESIDSTETVDSSETEDVSDESKEVAVHAAGETAETEYAAFSGSTYWTTLQEAINEGPYNIYLAKDVTETVTIPAGKTVNVSLYGHQLHGSITNNGNLTIDTYKQYYSHPDIGGGDATITNEGTLKLACDGATGFVVNNSGALNITGGATYKVSNITNTGSGVIEITSGTFDEAPDSSWLRAGYKATLKSGTYIVSAMTNTEAAAAGFVAVSSMTPKHFYTTLQDAITNNSSTVNVIADVEEDCEKTNGDIILFFVSPSKFTGSLKASGDIKITNGPAVLNNVECNSFTAKKGSWKNTTDITIKDGKVNNITVEESSTNYGVTVAITGGTYTGTVSETTEDTLTISGGKFTADVTNYLAKGATYDAETGVVTPGTTGVAKIGDTAYETLEEALQHVTLETPLTWVSDAAWPADTPVYYNGRFYATIGELLYDAQQKKGVITPEANVATAVIYCRPGAAIATGSNGAHPSYVTSTTIYGNGAKLAGSTEWDVENYYTLTKDITINLYNLNGGASVWGTRKSDYTVTVNMVNCEDAHEVLFNYGSGNGKVIVTVKNSTFLKSSGAAHGWPVSINCLGSLTVESCTFDGVITGVVVNVKQPAGDNNRTMTVSVKNSTFKDVTGQDGNKGALRVTGQQECDIGCTIANVEFTGSRAVPEDITIGNVEPAKNLGKVSYEISGTDASMTVHKTGETEAAKETIESSKSYTGNNLGDETPAGYVEDTNGNVTISDEDGLFWFAKQVNENGNTFAGKTVVLAADIDLKNAAWTPIGTSTNQFKGTFDGQNKTISNISANCPSMENVGLFGFTTNCTLKNVTLENVDIKGKKNVGGLAGTVYAGSTVENVTVKGNIKISASVQYVGGIAGYSYAKYVNCKVIGDGADSSYIQDTLVGDYTNYAGGIVGLYGEGAAGITGCEVSDITIRTVGYGAGGITGVLQYNNRVSDCKVKNVVIDSQPADSNGWAGTLAGKDYTKNGSNTSWLINNTIENTVIKVGGVEIANQYMGDDHTGTYPPHEEYEANAIIGTDVEYDESGKITAGTFITVGAKARETLESSISDSKSLSKGSDDTYNVTEKKAYVAEINGTGYETLDAAIAAANDGDTIIVNAGEYKLNGSLTYTGKAFTIKAADGAKVSFDMSAAVALHGAKITFENVTFDYKTNGNYIGMQHTDTLVYNNCTINGQAFLYATNETFNNCTFNQSSKDAYNVWTYGAKNVAFNSCTFKCAGKSVLVYNEGSNEQTDLTVTDTQFNASETVNGKAAIEIDTSLMAGGATVIVDEKSAATGFSNETTDNAGLWNIKKKNLEKNKVLDVTVAGEKVYSLPVAVIGTAEYPTITAAITAAANGDTVTLLADTTEDVVISKNITLDLCGKTLTNTNAGKATISVTGGTVTVKNGNVVGGTSYYNIEVTKDSNANLTLEGVTATAGNTGSSMIDNYGTLTITSGTYTGGLNVVKSEEGSKLTITGGTFTLEYATNGYTGVVFAYGDTTISGGEFIQNLTTTGRWNHPTVILTGVVEGYTAITRVTGGHFVNKMSGESIFRGVGKGTSDNFEVSGGTFNKSISDGFCADGFIPTKNADGTYGVKEGKYVAKIGSTGYEKLADAIKAATSSSKIVKLVANVTESIEIASNKTRTLDLNGFKLTNAEGTHTIVNNGTLTIKDSSTAQTGTVDNVTHGRGALVNNGTVILSGGTFERSAEKGKFEPYGNGGNSWYTIANYGTMTINEGTTVKNAGGYSSNIRNGGQDSIANLTINGGTFDGGVNTVKNDANGVLEIKGGELKNTAQYVIMNWNQATISGGTFETAETAGAVLFSSAYGTDGTACGELTITGGTFKAAGSKLIDDAYDPDNHGTVKISGGSFNRAVDPKHCDTGFIPTQNEDGTYGVKEGTYVAETGGVYYESLQAAIDAAPRKGTVKLLADTRENVTINTPYLTLDLNGHTLNGGTEKGKPALTVTARVTVKDGSEAQTGTIMREDTAENSGVSSHYVIDIQGDGWLTFESGNVKNGSGVVGVKGASLVRVGDDSVAKYPGLNIKGGTFTQDNFIVIKVDRGSLFLNGGTLNSANSYAIEDWHRATIKGGTVNGTVAAWTYSGGFNSDLTISGGTINGDVTSVNYGNAEGKTAKVSITGGTINGNLDTRSYNPATNELTSIDDATKATIEVTGGTFNNDPTKYVVENSKVTNNGDGTFGVEKAYLAKIGDKSYYTMDEAFHAVTEGQTIVLLRDYTTASSQNSGSKSFTFDLNGFTWTYTSTDVNCAAFEINYPDVTLTVKNGKVVSNSMLGLIPSAMGGTITYDNAGLVFEGIDATANGHSGIETNGNNTNDSVTLKNSTLNVPNGFGIYFPSSGTLTIENSKINAKTMGVQVCAGSLKISGADTAITVTGDAVPKTENDGAIQDGAAISIVNRTGYKGLGTITVTGGTFTAKTGNAAIKAYNYADKTESSFNESDKVEVSGGTFSAEVPADLCAPGYVPQDNGDGTYGVAKAPAVAKIGEAEFTSLKDAIATAEAGATIEIIRDINTPTVSYEITKNLTIKLNGHTITADGYDAVFQIGKNADVVLEGPGSVVAVENTGSAGKYAMAVWACGAGCKVTINGKINFSQNITHTDDPQMDMIYASKGTIIINDGRYESGTPAWTLNCKDAAYKDGTANIIVNGGTFVGCDPRNNTAEGKGTSFVAAGVGVDKNTDGTFTAKPNMVAQIVDADGNSVAAYATLKEAVNAAKSGETVIVLKEATVEEMITAEANITIDLNQKTVTVADGAGTMLKTTGDVTIKNGTLTSAVTANIINAYGKLKLESVKIYGSTVDGSNLVNVLGNAEVTIDAASEIEADGVGVAVFVGAKSADKDAKYTLNIYGKVIQKGKSYAISGNGSYPGTSYINIYEGAEVKASNIAENNDCCAIYQPQAGEINVYGGLVEGYCAIVMKSGTLNISGGTVRGIRNDNVLGDNNSAGNGASYDGSAIVVDSRKTGYAGNVKINVTGGTVESYYSTAIREIGNDSSMTQLVELTVTGGEILGASKNLTNAENDILVRDISVSNVAISGGTFNHEVQADYCAVGYEPSEKDASGMYTVQKVSGNAYYTDDDGNLHYGYLTTLLNNEATVGRVITLIDSVDYKGSLVVEGNRTINLAGYTFESEFYVFVTNGCGIKDSTDGSALIKVAPEKLVFMSNNEQLPIYDSANKGYRLFNCKVKGKCETNGDSATIWVLPEFENKAAYKLLKSGNAHNATISVTISWTGNDGPAAQEFTFKQSLIDIYAAGEGGATFTLRLTGLGTALSGEMSNIKAQSSIKSGAGVSFTGKEYSLSN